MAYNIRRFGLVAAALGAYLCLVGVAEAELWHQQAKLTDEYGTLFDRFGYSVATNGDRIIVGAWGDDDRGPEAGAAYLFDTTTGDRLLKLHAEDAATGDQFGWSVAISGDTAIVGARNDDGVNGSSYGSAYLFDVNTGRQLHKLVADDGASWDKLGSAVDISGNVAIVGAPEGGVYDQSGRHGDGVAYLFSVTSGEQLFKLGDDITAEESFFGMSVAVSGDTAIVGAPGDNHSGIATGAAYLFDVANGEQIARLIGDDLSLGGRFGVSVDISGDTAIVGGQGIEPSGAAYLFSVATREQLHKLTDSDTAAGDKFGASVAVSADTAIVGAWLDDGGGYHSGAAYLFDVVGGERIQKLVADDAAPEDAFGSIVAISGETVVVGAYGNDDTGESSGSAYIFVPEPSTIVLLGIGAVGLLMYAPGRIRKRRFAA